MSTDKVDNNYFTFGIKNFEQRIIYYIKMYSYDCFINVSIIYRGILIAKGSTYQDYDVNILLWLILLRFVSI